MTPQRSQIFRAFARGESIAQIAQSRGVNYAQAWTQLGRAIAAMDRKGGSARDTIRWQQYLILMRIIDQAQAAFERSFEEGVREITSETVEGADSNGKICPTARSVTRRIRKDAGNVRYLEVALMAVREIKDLWLLGAEAESKVGARARKGSLLLDALALKGSIQIRTQWAESVEQRRAQS